MEKDSQIPNRNRKIRGAGLSFCAGSGDPGLITVRGANYWPPPTRWFMMPWQTRLCCGTAGRMWSDLCR